MEEPRGALRGAIPEVAWVALKLGLTSFGGPIAHLGYFHREYVQRRRWLDEASFADLVALAQLLPGPASSQLGIAIGTLRAGPLGGLVAWVGFTLPSVMALVVFAQLTSSADLSTYGWIHGLKVAAVAVVAQAVFTMWRSLAPDPPRRIIAVGAASIALLAPSPLTQVFLIVSGCLLGGWLLRATAPLPASAHVASPFGRRAGAAFLSVFVALLVGLPILRELVPEQGIGVAESFYRAGSLVFGGGHLVLPLLRDSVVQPGWVTDSTFLVGYGAAQAVPGPLFTFAAYLGAVIDPGSQVRSAAIATVAIFLPSFLLIWGVLPFWHQLRGIAAFRRALAGTNAAVVGMLLAALYQPIWVSAVTSIEDAALAIGVFVLLVARGLPAWAAVIVCAAAGEVIARLQ